MGETSDAAEAEAVSADGDHRRNDDGAGEAGAPRTSRELREAASAPLARQLSRKYLEEHCLLPLEVADDRLVVAVGEELDPSVIDELAWTFGCEVELVEAPAAEIHAAIMSAEALEEPDLEGDLPEGEELELVGAGEEALDDLRAQASQAPVIKLVNMIILEALRSRASDIHIEASDEGLRVRYRVDGVLQEVSRPPAQYRAAVMSRIKVMADLDIAERRAPQDGRIRLRLSERDVDLRVSLLPGLHGENAVLRILDRGASVRDLEELGMSGDVLVGFGRLIELPHGIVLVTGPTGSGKTTTLYGALARINRPGVKTITVEDPVEYEMEGITQMPVNPKAGVTFANSLRSILRHDPDVIMVGEMRDAETASLAIQAALTGHLVFSTLHTNDAPGGVTRLLDMGVEPYLVSATVEGVLAQRLVRTVCEDCAEPYEPSAERIARASGGAADPPPAGEAGFRRGTGCQSCGGTGYRGRTGVFELMTMDDRLRASVVRREPLDDLRRLAAERGMVPLREAGWPKVLRGETTAEELLRVTQVQGEAAGEEPGTP